MTATESSQRPCVVLALTLVLSAGGCGRSVLIHRDDGTYRRALDHFQRTRQLVAASLAPDDDQAVFLQAEGFFRYRFAPPGRSLGSYVAQATAAIVNLPVLDSLAGSLDLYSLRVRTNDAAVQLCESLLERNPSTTLRPLTLYRLGWAYRNSIASGFPGSSELAFGEIASNYPDSPFAPLAAEARKLHWKSQGSATAWSIVPGLGQMYAGELGNGALRLAVALAATAMIVVPSVLAYQRGSDLSWSRDWPLFVVGLAGASTLAIDYSTSFRDAQRAALEFNERQEAAFEDQRSAAP